MQTVTLVSAFVLVAMLLLTAPPAADAACCHARSAQCDDCTGPTPYCGYGKCNLFGCGCVCRTGACYKKRSVDDQAQIEDVESLMIAGDLNGDGLLSIDEAETMLLQGPAAEHRRSVRSLDKNMDGLLSADEIDN